MKRLLAMLLALVMVLPMCLIANAAETNVEKEPFNISNMEDLGTDYDNFWPRLMIWSRLDDEFVSEDHLKVIVPGTDAETPTDIAEFVKEVYDEYPDGMRHINLISLRSALVHLSEDIIFMEKGVKLIKEWFDEFLYHYKEIGGKLDGVNPDMEYFDGFYWQLNQAEQKDPQVYKKIVDNPNYATRIRPELEAYGFKFWPNVTNETPEIYCLNVNTGSEYAQSREIWNVVIRNHYNRYLDEAVYETLKELYPDAIYTDYQARVTYAWDKIECESGGTHQYLGGNHTTVGNVNYFNTYAARPGTSFFYTNGAPIYKNIPSYNGVAYGDDPFNMMYFEANFAKALKASAPDGKFTAIIAWHNYSGRTASYCNTPYFSEMAYHLGMLDPDPYQSYMIEDEIEARGEDVDYAVQIVSELMDELTRVAGYADRKHVAVPYTWNDKYVLTGMYAGGRNIWRITPDTINTGVSLKDFKVEGTKDVTFSIAGQTITFPGGKIIEDTKITEVGSCGYWVETAKDVLPVITFAEDRFEQNPAFLESYDSYEAGSTFDFNLAAPMACWEVKKTKNATAKIAELDGSMALALDGDFTMKLKTVLKNVTAGDTYAKNQAWEIEVGVPADLSAEAEIIVLNLYTDKPKPIEGGFKIAGGKLYYDKAGEYVELEGVDVSAGGKFRLKRNMDFSNAEAVTCDYSVYDASGKLLGEVKDVPMVAMEIPVEKLSFGVSKITGEAVKFDNFKLYANGLAADFEVYDAYAGRKFSAEEMEKPYSKNVAYRMSWLNGTAYEKAYSIIAAYYNGDKLVEEKVIQEIKMAPGVDHVETGIVEVKDGLSVKLYARNDSKTEPNSDKPIDKNNTIDFNSDDTILLIAVIVIAVVLVAVVVVAVLMLTKKKPAAKKTTKKTPKKVTKDKTAE